MAMDFSSPASLETLSYLFANSLSPLPEPRHAAESSLSSAADIPGFALSVLLLASSAAADEQVRRAAAVHFKNLVRSRWSPSDSNVIPISAPEKDQIKAQLLPLMLSSPSPVVRRQLSDALSIVSSLDFPQNWPSLLPDLVSSLGSSPDYPSKNGLLDAADSIFRKFRHSFDTSALRLDLKYCLDRFAGPLLETFLATDRLIPASLSDPIALSLLLKSQLLCCEIFRSLNSIELPEFFEDHMAEWMSKFREYLTVTYPQSVEDDAYDLRTAVCENLQLYLEKNEEEFKDYLKDFASAVWSLLIATPAGGSSPKRDQLTITATRFLTTIATSVHHSLFGSPEVLQQICQSIVFPNVRLRDEDLNNFNDNYIEYIRRDIEGSDTDTQRKISCELLKGLALNYKDQVTTLVSVQIQTMLSLYSANPGENWKEKDAAIYLVVALASKGTGGGAVAGHLVDVESFFTTVIVPELQSSDVNAAPVLKAGALKFFMVFREQIPKQAGIALLPDVIRFLASESNVVHSYAANCIDKLLLVKDRIPVTSLSGTNVVMFHPRYGVSDINPFLGALMNNLFNALQLPESEENQYVMKCIMRVLSHASLSGDVAGACIARLSLLLTGVCNNPSNPVFNHYLFEAIAAVIGRSCENDPSLIRMFEGSLFPVLHKILVDDIAEFWPYAFQIFAQLVELSKPPLSENYLLLFEVLLLPETWKRSANAPALVRLLQAYLQKLPNELNSGGKLSQVLGIFEKLVSSPSTEELGFYVLNTVIENLSYDVIAPYIGRIWSILFTRLQNNRTVKFVNSLIIFMSLVLVKHGPAVLMESINAVQPNIFASILQQFWIPNLKHIYGSVEVKLASIASTRLMCESPSLLDPSAVELWGKMLDGIITLLAQPEQYAAELQDGVPEIIETAGYSASFARLHNAGKKVEDPLKEIRDAKEFLVTSLARLSALSPGRYTEVIKRHVDPSNQAALLELCGSYNCVIP